MEVKISFQADVLRDLAYDDAPDEYQVIENVLVGHSRWSLQYRMVFMFGDLFFQTHYNKGATEMQDESPYEYDSEMVECLQVRPKLVEVTKYVAVQIKETDESKEKRDK